MFFVNVQYYGTDVIFSISYVSWTYAKDTMNRDD